MADYSFTYDPQFQTEIPQFNPTQECFGLIEARGGFQNITAEEAQQLAQAGCLGAFPVEFGGDSYPEESPSPGEEISFSGGIPEPVSLDERPLWTNVEPDFVPQSAGIPQSDSSPQSTLEDQMPGINFGAVTTDFENALMSTVSTATGDWLQDPSLGQVLEKAAQTLLPQFFQRDQIEAGITAVASQRCFTAKNSKRRRIKLVRGADGQLHPVIYCAKPRMNPLNPQALRRSAVRLARFHAISKTIEKLVSKACKGTSRNRRLPSSCAPRKKGCR